MLNYYLKKLAYQMQQKWPELCDYINGPIKSSDIQKELYEEFMNYFNYYSPKGRDDMKLKDYMVNAYLLGDNLHKMITTLDEEIKNEIPPIIRNSCEDIYVEYMEYDDKSIVRIVIDCTNNVENDLNRLLNEFCEGWYVDNDYDYGLSFCYDLNPDNIEKFTKGGKEWLMKNKN